MRTFAAVALTALFTAGCATAPPTLRILRSPQFNYPATEPSAVTIYTSPPGGAYEIIGEVRTRVPADVPMERLEAPLKEEAAKIGATGVVLVVKDVVSEQKIRRPVAGSQQPVGTSGTPGAGGVATIPTQTGRTEEVTIRVHEKEVTGIVIRVKK